MLFTTDPFFSLWLFYWKVSSILRKNTQKRVLLWETGCISPTEELHSTRDGQTQCSSGRYTSVRFRALKATVTDKRMHPHREVMTAMASASGRDGRAGHGAPGPSGITLSIQRSLSSLTFLLTAQGYLHQPEASCFPSHIPSFSVPPLCLLFPRGYGHW